MGCIQIRWILAILGVYACSMLTASRTAMSVAIIAMTRVAHHSKSVRSDLDQNFHCAKIDNNISTVSIFTEELFHHDANETIDGITPEFEWNETLQVLCHMVNAITNY